MQATISEILSDLAPYCVVVGSLGRGASSPRDIDLLYDPDHEDTIRWLIKDHGVRFDSVLPGHWKLIEYDIELLPFHQGPDYEVCRAHAYALMVHGVEVLAYNDLHGHSTSTEAARYAEFANVEKPTATYYEHSPLDHLKLLLL